MPSKFRQFENLQNYNSCIKLTDKDRERNTSDVRNLNILQSLKGFVSLQYMYR